MQFVTIYICPIRSSLPYIHSSIFLLPLFLPHIFRRLIFFPLSASFLFLPTNKNVAPKANSFFFFFHFLRIQARNSRNATKHHLRGLSMYLFPPVVFISHTQAKEGCQGVV